MDSTRHNMPAGHYRARVADNRPLSRRYYLLSLSRPETMPVPGPGSFIHVMVPAGGRFFLRRPFSVLDCNDDTISLIIVEKGEGTRVIRDLDVGAELDLIGPLGRSFPRMPGRRVLALGGGVGLAPLYYYGRRREARDCESYRLLYGARSREDLFLDRFDWDTRAVAFSSDDGSYGHAGTVVELAEREIERAPADVVFSCGPNPMLKAAAGFAARRGLPHYVSLENRMACAMGACRSCVVPVRENGGTAYRTVCSDGPVFDAETLLWEQLPTA
ncbi:MAG: dihydroorotate dehydrogenase electron transfer subunit [Candidatus Krumholzibacteriia bacterium]